MPSKFATPFSVFEAAVKALGNIEKNPRLIASAVSGGMVIPKGQKRGARKGHQVFVTVRRWDEAKMIAQPLTGGLV
jgi:hypothetical protein